MIATRQRVTHSFNWLFRSRDNGRLTVAQWPNLSLAIVLTITVARRLMHTTGDLDGVLRWTGAGALGWWSLDEIIRGVNPFRRALGVVVIARLLIRLVDAGSVLG